MPADDEDEGAPPHDEGLVARSLRRRQRRLDRILQQEAEPLHREILRVLLVTLLLVATVLTGLEAARHAPPAWRVAAFLLAVAALGYAAFRLYRCLYPAR